MTYLNGKKELVLKLRANGMRFLGWFVDTSYATHSDMKSHTVSVTKMIKGSIIKKKLNKEISSEVELVGADDIIPDILWIGYF